MADHANTNDGHGHDNDTPFYDDINTANVVLIGIISGIVTLLLFWGVQGLCYQMQKNYKNLRASEDRINKSAIDDIDSQKSILNGGDGIVAIDDAMTAVIDTYGEK